MQTGRLKNKNDIDVIEAYLNLEPRARGTLKGTRSPAGDQWANLTQISDIPRATWIWLLTIFNPKAV